GRSAGGQRKPTRRELCAPGPLDGGTRTLERVLVALRGRPDPEALRRVEMRVEHRVRLRAGLDAAVVALQALHVLDQQCNALAGGFVEQKRLDELGKVCAPSCRPGIPPG